MDPRWAKGSSTIFLISLLTGCGGSYFVPMELAPSRVETTFLRSEPQDDPTLHVNTHADGLGWQIQARQAWIDHQQVAEREYWNGFEYRPAVSAGRRMLLTAGTVISCPGSFLAHLIVRGSYFLGLLDKAEPTWRLIKAYCVAPLLGFDPSTESTAQRPGPVHDPTEVQERVIRPVTDGRVQIRWIHRRFDPVGAEYPLTSSSPTTDVRLRELAPVLLRAHAPDVLTEGSFEIALMTDKTTVREPLPITTTTLTALASDLVRRPNGDWPTPLRVRIETRNPELAEAAQITLTDLRIPIATRGSSARPLQSVQAKEVSPRYQDGLPTSIGHWTGANVLLALTAMLLTPTTQLFSVSVSSIETGLMLGQFTVEGSDARAPEVSSAIRGQLALLLTPEGPATRRGTMIEDRR
ncbi:MAG TPA: hypothetical protein VLA47_05670 [Nitrospira sp.]|nr:hypothetical protein [Nitrospira sp.]